MSTKQKSLAELKDAPSHIQEALYDYINYHNLATDIELEINDLFPSPLFSNCLSIQSNMRKTVIKYIPPDIR